MNIFNALDPGMGLDEILFAKSKKYENHSYFRIYFEIE